MNSFLKSLQKEIKSDGEFITVGDSRFLVIDSSPSIRARLQADGNRIAEESLSGRKSALSKKILTKAEKAEIQKVYKGRIGKDELSQIMSNINNHYQLELMIRTVQYVQDNYYLEIIRNPDGTKIYSKPEEKAQIREGLEAIPGLAERVEEAFQKIQEKKSSDPTNQKSKSLTE